MVIACAGRFNADFIADAGRQLVAALPEVSFAGWGLSYCYGNRLESRRSAKPGAEGIVFTGLEDVKTDMVLLALNETGADAGDPLARRDKGRDWAWCARPSSAPGSEPALRTAEYARRLLLELDPDDPVATTEAVRAAGPACSCFFISADLLLADLRVPALAGQAPAAWQGTGQLVTVLSPLPLEQLPNITWEPVEPGTALALTRFRHELP